MATRKSLGEMTDKIKKSFIGLLIMVSAPLLAALIGLFFFGDASFLLQPTILTPEDHNMMRNLLAQGLELGGEPITGAGPLGR